MTDLSEINLKLSQEITDLNTFLKKATSTDVSLINTLSSYMIDSGGKRIRPIILFLISKIMNNKSNMIESAAIIELIHAATLLHDDVVDQSDIRHNINTANKLYGNDSAVLVGDFLYSRAFELIVAINRDRVYKILAETTNKISQGEVLQLMFKGKIIESEEKYIDIIYLKTGKLFEASALVAADIADCSDNDWPREFGKNFGIAYQLRNDYLDYFGDEELTGKKNGKDFQEGKFTLPVIMAMKLANSKDKSAMISLLQEGDLKKFPQMLDYLVEKNINSKIKETFTFYSTNCLDSLEILPESPYKDALKDIVINLDSRLT